jgi:glycosyltransferase involved in cell wall biosynthesis
LRRAIASLQAQTFTDWVCELHNDDPADDEPAQVWREIGDARIRYVRHDRNLGPVASFNFAFAGAEEEFVSILEDDNWWERDFLSLMVAALTQHPETDLAWGNMRIWQETADGWHDTGRTIWPQVTAPCLTLAWPQLLQFDTPLHSHGAMLLRSRAARADLQVTTACPVDVIENIRERGFRYPLALVTAPVANFALTRTTARSLRRSVWVETQALLASAFFEYVPLSSDDEAKLWASRRSSHPPATSLLFFVAWHRRAVRFLRHATMSDWWIFLRGCVRHPGVTAAALTARHRRSDLAALFTRVTAGASAQVQSTADIPPLRLARRADLARFGSPAIGTPSCPES